MGSYASGLGGELSCPVIDQDLHAYVDRQLTAERLPVVERYLEAHSELGAAGQRIPCPAGGTSRGAVRSGKRTDPGAT